MVKPTEVVLQSVKDLNDKKSAKKLPTVDGKKADELLDCHGRYVLTLISTLKK